MLTAETMLIYLITNKVNNKVYVGQTTRTLDQRWKDYKSSYKSIKLETSGWRPIIAAMQKYNIESFKVEIIKDNILTQKELDYYEIFYIKKYDSTNPGKGYNIELGGNGIGKHSEQTKQKISEAQLGEKNHMYGKRGELSKSSKRIIDLTTGIIYVSATEASEKLGLGTNAVTKICACARGDRHSAYKRVFRYVDDKNNPIIVQIPLTTETIQPILDTTTNKEYETLKQAADDIGCSISGVSSVLKGKRNSVFGHTFSYLEKREKQSYKYNKIFDLILPKYKYVVNTVLNPEYQEKCNDYPEREQN